MIDTRRVLAAPRFVGARLRSLMGPKIVMAVLIVAVHLVVLGLFAHFDARRQSTGMFAPEFIAPAQIIVQLPQWDKVPAPEVDWTFRTEPMEGYKTGTP